MFLYVEPPLHCYRYVKVQLQGISPSHGVTGNTGYVLLENPVGDNVLDLKHLYHEVSYFLGTLYVYDCITNMRNISGLFIQNFTI